MFNCTFTNCPIGDGAAAVDYANAKAAAMLEAVAKCTQEAELAAGVCVVAKVQTEALATMAKASALKAGTSSKASQMAAKASKASMILAKACVSEAFSMMVQHMIGLPLPMMGPPPPVAAAVELVVEEAMPIFDPVIALPMAAPPENAAVSKSASCRDRSRSRGRNR